MTEYEIVVGLEVHAELSTQSKIYCTCRNKFGAEVNTEACPVCMGLPGALPVLNEKVVEYAVRMGYATGCAINAVSKQDRKNYFYPDLPKAYQISQFDVPLCEHGFVDVLMEGGEKRIGVTRIHIEEDAGKLLHGESFSGTLVDFNRCGVPLIEIVSEPDLRSSAEAKAYLETITSILRALDISDCKMQEGSIRADVNVSVRPKGSETLGTRCEMKNINSYNAMVRAIEYESQRQIDVIESGGTIEQQTRRWDDVHGESVLMRSKEDAQDYRYFPEPDLGTIVLEDDYLARLRASIPELPNKRRMRYINDYALPAFDAGLIAEDPERTAFFEECLKIGGVSPKALVNWLIGDIARLTGERTVSLAQSKLTPAALVALTSLIEKGSISNTAGKTVVEELFANGGDPNDIVAAKGLAQVSDEAALEHIAREVLAANEKSVADYKKGKTNAVGFLVGQCMRASKGKANPKVVNDLLRRLLDES